MGEKRSRLATVALVAVSLAACDRAGGTGPIGPTVPLESTTTAAPAIDITTKPDVVTVEYAQAVMVELDRILGEAVRAMVADDGPNKEFLDKLNAVYDEPSFENKQSVYGKLAAEGLGGFRKPPGNPITTVESILRSDPTCVVFAVKRDFAPFLVAPNPESSDKGFIAWTPKTSSSDPAGFNRTPWSVVFDGDTFEDEDPRNAC
ncbi:MAG: hypothetical protein M3P34_07020 [Actinomycetota bacterium]|nr:hypothetical protein [Actinomycetota bacterium]